MVGNESEVGRLTILTDMVLRQWVPQKVQMFEWWEAENSVPYGWGLGNWDILIDELGMMSDENWVKSDEYWFFKNQTALK